MEGPKKGELEDRAYSRANYVVCSRYSVVIDLVWKGLSSGIQGCEENNLGGGTQV